jgi:hypothetical protein
MIQRIQTVYLLVASILLGLIFFLPIADISAAENVYMFDIQGIHRGTELIMKGWPLLLFLFFVILIHVIIIFMFKKRLVQVRLLIFAIILLLGLFSAFFWFGYMGVKDASTGFKLTIAIPMLDIILDYLAIKAIAKDEALVRSVDRIR